MIELEDVTKTFDDVVAVDHASLRLERGLTHVLLGSSGCGKSTILLLVLGLISPAGAAEGDLLPDGEAGGPRHPG